MRINGSAANSSASHDGWRKRIVEEKEWPQPPPDYIHNHVCKHERELWQQAEEASKWERDDISLEGMQREFEGRGNSRGLPSDWIPRAALLTGLKQIDLLIWAGISRAWRLLVRPKVWAITRQVALYKKHDVDTFKSWRNIMINTQLGLLWRGASGPG